MILIDTNVISEVMRAEPDAKVKAWLNDQMRGEVGITAITVTEVLYGIISLDINDLAWGTSLDLAKKAGRLVIWNMFRSCFI